MAFPRVSRLAAVALLTVLSSPASAQSDRPRNYQFDLPSFAEVVHPMRHPLNGRMPLLAWNLPLPVGKPLAFSRQSGALRKAVDQIAARGLAPTIIPPGDGATALGLTLQEAGQPIYVLIPVYKVMEINGWTHSTVWANGPDAWHRPQKWVCVPLADAKPGEEWITKRLQPLRDAGLKAAGVFLDDEGQPNPFNGIYEATLNSAESRAQYPPGTLDSFPKFESYVMGVRARLLDEMLAGPSHALFPSCVTGNFGESTSSEASPYVDCNGHSYPPMPCGADAAMPGLYANTSLLPRHLQEGPPMTQARADQIYWYTLLRAFSTTAPNAKAAGKKLIPFVGQAVYGDISPNVRFVLSRNLWRELLIHLWLRGADGMYLFNLGGPNTRVSPEFSFRSVEDARQIYDDLLEYREFLDKGEPMNYAVNELYGQEPVWSGLRLADRCLVRAFTPGTSTGKVRVKAYDGVTVDLDAPPEGAMYWVGKDGGVKRVGQP